MSFGTPAEPGFNAPYTTPALAIPENSPIIASREYHARLMATSAGTTDQIPA